MSNNDMWQAALSSLTEWEKEVQEHNETILTSIDYDLDDYEALMDDGCTRITGKMEWVETPDIKPEQEPDIYGAFTLSYVEQWTTNMEGDSYAGFMYVAVRGNDKFLKIPYSC